MVRKTSEWARFQANGRRKCAVVKGNGKERSEMSDKKQKDKAGFQKPLYFPLPSHQ
jgi:hypothetical protein